MYTGRGKLSILAAPPVVPVVVGVVSLRAPGAKLRYVLQVLRRVIYAKKVVSHYSFPSVPHVFQWFCKFCCGFTKCSSSFEGSTDPRTPGAQVGTILETNCESLFLCRPRLRKRGMNKTHVVLVLAANKRGEPKERP